jgi:hypothetical protein
MRLALAALLAAGCAHTARPDDGLLARAHEMAARIEALRGLGEKAPIRVQLLEDAPFRALFRKKNARNQTHDGAVRDRALFVAFGFLPPEVDSEALLRDVLDEQVAGFYDDREKRLFVRNDHGDAAKAEMSVIILAHEIEHALQDQHFGLPELAALADDDTRLARAAVFEGDATLVMLAYAALQAKMPLAEVLERAGRALGQLGGAGLLQAVAPSSPKLARAPTLVREALTFPYFDGMRLLTELYRTGGFALVDRAFRAPPSSTEQVLHPEKYVAGELPIPVRAPAVPAGFRAVTSGRLGELGTRALLEICLPYGEARAAAEGWGGDAYTIVEAPDGALALLWSTAWDSDARAERFEKALTLLATCWPPAATAPPHARRWVSSRHQIERSGSRVALVRGLSDGERPAAATALLALVDPTRPASPPLGAITLRAPEPPRDERVEDRGVIDGAHYRSTRLGLSAELPQGFAATVGEKGFELVLKRGQPSRAFAFFAFSPAHLGAELEEPFYAAFPQQFVLGGAAPKEEDRGHGRVAFGEGSERSWSFPGRAMRVRASLLPICSGRATLVFAQVWEDPTAMATLDGWRQSFVQVDPDPPACKALR